MTGRRTNAWEELAKASKYVAMRKQVVWIELEIPCVRKSGGGFLTGFRRIPPFEDTVTSPVRGQRMEQDTNESSSGVHSKEQAVNESLSGK